MSGCDWQKPSFSVSLEEKILDNCYNCKADIMGVIYKHNGDVLCETCFRQLPAKLNFSEEGTFLTNKDKLYEFVDNKNFSKPTEVRGKGHWKRLLKEHGLTDDFSQSRKDLVKIKGDDRDKNKLDRGFVKDQILSELHDKGLYHKLIKRR